MLLWTLDPHVTPHDYYAMARLGMDNMVKNGLTISKRYYKMTHVNVYHDYELLELERVFYDSNLSNECPGPSLTTGDVICVYGGKYSGMWFVNGIGFIKLWRPKWRFNNGTKK